MKKIIFAVLFIFTAFNLYAQTVPFTLSIENISSNKGSIMVGVCIDADEFAEKYPCKYSFSIPAKKGSITQQINVNKGKYGIIVYHDENNNGILDRAMFGKPEERYGFSNNKYGAFGSKPPFEEALINVDGQTSAVIKLRK